MTIIPIQVTDEGVLIPKTYLHNATEVEVEMTADYVIVRSKPATREKVDGSGQTFIRDTPVHIYSPRLADPNQASDFAMKAVPES